jgi:hypothetical protein
MSVSERVHASSSRITEVVTRMRGDATTSMVLFACAATMHVRNNATVQMSRSAWCFNTTL